MAPNPSVNADVGVVVAGFGRHFLVQAGTIGAAEPRLAVSRGRNADIAVGDRVRLGHAGADQAVIEQVLERRNLLQRSNGRRRKILATNIDQAILVIAPEPVYSEAIVLRVGIAAMAAGIPLRIAANKSDSDAFEKIAPRLAVFESAGLTVWRISAKADPDRCRQILVGELRDRTTLLMGESGMGKSTLLNLLVPDAAQRTGEYSKALQSGRHTTTFSRMFALASSLAGKANVIDTPGFQQFGIAHVSQSEREHGMPEFSDYIGRCRFHNCLHLNEPGCAIRDAVASGAIDRVRYKIFSTLNSDP